MTTKTLIIIQTIIILNNKAKYTINFYLISEEKIIKI